MLKPVQASTYTFRTIIEGGYVYVDKTRYLYELVRQAAGIYFLARPRRFGKSLLISTLEALFKGEKDLFQGLWLSTSDYSWQTYPVIRLDFSRHAVKSAERLEQVIDYYIEEIALEHGLTLRGFDYQSRFENLIQQLGRTSKVVILIDEYDKPIIDNIENLAEAKRIREILKNFYTVIKAMDAYIRFVFITGISKFSKVGVFSSLNHLTDLTMNPAFATALGITEEELHDNFREHLVALAQREGMTTADLARKVQQWYDGFCFVEHCQNVYNPFSTLQLFFHQRFANYWFETGTPTFLIKLIKLCEYDLPQLTQLEVSELGFSTFEIEHLEIIPLLFQTGYLTIKGYNAERQLYQLAYPNQEVENAFLVYLLEEFSSIQRGFNESYLWQLIDALKAKNFDSFFSVLNVFFANIDYDLHLDYEKYYQTIFYLVFLLLGVNVTAEVKTSRGRIDPVVELAEVIYLFEFKFGGSAATALKQIKDNEYHQKYRLRGKPLTLIGAKFDRKKRKVTEWKMANEAAL